MTKTWLVGIAMFGAAACSTKPNRMPKGFERLKLGVGTKEALNTVLSVDQWRDRVQLQVATVTVKKKLGLAKDTESALKLLEHGADELREQAKDRYGVPTVNPKITIEGATPFQSIELDFDGGALETVTFNNKYDDRIYEDYLSQAKSRFGRKCDPEENHELCDSSSCAWSFCEERLTYKVEKMRCHDDSSGTFIELRRDECPSDGK